MDLLHSLMPALEATGLVPAASMNVRPETHKGLLPQQVAELPRCRGADRPSALAASSTARSLRPARTAPGRRKALLLPPSAPQPRGASGHGESSEGQAEP